MLHLVDRILEYGGVMAAKKGRTAPGDTRRRSRQFTTEHLVLALTSVAGSTAACVTHGDEKTVAVLVAYYALVAEAATQAGGHVVKVMGDAVLVTFPCPRVGEAVEALHSLQARGTAVWHAFDERCRVEVKVAAGPVVCGPFGPPGEEQPDVYGAALNQLFKGAPGEFRLSPEVEALLREQAPFSKG